eukprot:8296040-Pyramimonas_sp.AAC.1
MPMVLKPAPGAGVRSWCGCWRWRDDHAPFVGVDPGWRACIGRIGKELSFHMLGKCEARRMLRVRVDPNLNGPFP